MKRRKDKNSMSGWRIETTWFDFLVWIDTKCPENLRWVYKNAIKESRKRKLPTSYTDHKLRPIYFVKNYGDNSIVDK